MVTGPLLRALAVFGLLGTALAHASVVDDRLRAWWPAAVVALTLQAAETALAFALAVRQSPRVCRAAVAVSLGGLALWAVSGPRGASAGRGELAAAALEATTALVAIALLRSGAPRSLSAGALVRAGAVAAVVAIVAVDYLGNRAAENALTAARPAAAGHRHSNGPLRPGEYPLGKPLRTPTTWREPGFYFAARPLRRAVLELGVGPAATGIDTFDVVVVDYDGNRVDLPEVRLTATLPDRDVGPLRFAAERISPGHFVVDVARLAYAGRWLIHVEGRSKRRHVLVQHTFAVPIAESFAR